VSLDLVLIGYKSTCLSSANSVEDAVRRGQRQVEQVKLKMSMQMDDRVFHASMLETQVMNTKEHTKWNFETLQALIEGPLLNTKRLDEAIRLRFMRRLMSFFHPFTHRFSDTKNTRVGIAFAFRMILSYEFFQRHTNAGSGLAARC